MMIPPPNSGSYFATRTYAYQGSSPGGGGDPFGGGYGDYGSGQGSPLQQYSQNRQTALQMLQGGNLSPQEKKIWEKYLQDLDGWFQKYGAKAQGADKSQTSGDISANGGLYDGGSNGVPSPDFQDSSKIVYEKGTDYSWNLGSKESRTVYLYQQNIDLTWEYASGTMKLSKEYDSFLGKDVTVATVTDSKGLVHKVIMPNVKNLKTHTTDPKTQVISDATFNGMGVKLKNMALNATEEKDAKPKGTPPSKVDGETATWDMVMKDDNQTVEMTPFTEWKTMNAKVKGNINIIPNGNEEYYTFEYQAGPPAQYVVKVYDDPTDRSEGHLKTTMKIDASLVKTITFAGDKSRAEFLGELADKKDPHKINAENENAKKLICGDASGVSKVGSAASKKYSSDTAIDEINGNTALYNSPDLKAATIHADYNDEIDTHEIWAMGTVDVKGYNAKDAMRVVDYQAGPPPVWKVEIYKDGITDKNKPGYKVETVIIHGSKDTKVALWAMDANLITYGNAEWKNKVKINGNDGSDNTKILGEEALDVKTGNDWANKNYIAGTYDQKPDPNLTNKWDFEADTYLAYVNASGTVTINAGNQAEKYIVSGPVGNWITVQVSYKDKDGKTKWIKYFIDKDKVKQIKIVGIDSSQVDLSNLKEEKYLNKVVGSDGKPLGKAQQASGQAPDANAISDDLKKNAGIEDLKKNLGLYWHKNMSEAEDYSWVYEFVNRAMNGISRGMKEGNWDDLKAAMDYLKSKAGGDQWQDERLNNGYGALFISLYNVLGKSNLQSVFAKMKTDRSELFDSFINGYNPSSTAGQFGNRLNMWQAGFDSDGEGDPDKNGQPGGAWDSGNHYWVTGGWGNDSAFTENGELSTWEKVKTFLEAAGKGS